MTIRLPKPVIKNISLEPREGGSGELVIEYIIPTNPNTGYSGTVLFLRPINDPLNVPELDYKYYLSGPLSFNDVHYLFAPVTRRNRPAQIRVPIPLYTTYYAGLATYLCHEHSFEILDSNQVDRQFKDILTNDQLLSISSIATLRKTVPQGLVLKNPGTLRLEDIPDPDPGPTYLSQQSETASQAYRLTQTFIDEFQTINFLNLDRSSGYELILNAGNVSLDFNEIRKQELSTLLIAGLKADNQSTTFLLPEPIDTVDVIKFNNITWAGQDISIYAATGFNQGDVTEPENFRLISSGQDILANEGENTLNLRVDFLTANSFVKDVVVNYTSATPSVLYTKTLNFNEFFDQCVIFVDADDLTNIVVTTSIDDGITFVNSTGTEGFDYFNFSRVSNKIIIKFEIYGINTINGYSVSVGVKPTPPPSLIEGPNPKPL